MCLFELPYEQWLKALANDGDEQEKKVLIEQLNRLKSVFDDAVLSDNITNYGLSLDEVQLA